MFIPFYLVSFVLRHCWFGDRKGIWPDKISHQQYPHVLLQTNLGDGA